MQAPRIETQTLPPPPGILGSLRTGFDAIAGNVTVILLPLALDLLLWLGPRLSLGRLIQQELVGNLQPVPGVPGLDPSTMSANVDASMKALQAVNLFGLLHTFPIGIFSLLSPSLMNLFLSPNSMNLIVPTNGPWGAPAVWELTSASQLSGLILLLTLAGWVLGGLYFRWVAALAVPGMPVENRPQPGRAVVQTVAYAIVWTVVCWGVGLPLFFVLILLLSVNGVLAQGVVLLLGFLSMWLVVPIFFSPHGIFIRRQNAVASILSGFEMTRFTLPTSSLFVMVAFLLGVMLNLLWAQPAAGSWLVLIGIFGHAFVSTALLASSFVYYNNMSTWLQMALARLRSGLPNQRA